MTQLETSARHYAGVFILVLVAGCSTPQTSALLNLSPSMQPERAELTDVPYFAQEDNQCGPASLVMAMNHAGSNLDPLLLKDELYIPDKQGSLQVEMLATARRHGMLAYKLQPSLQDLLTEINAGHPVIVLQNLSLQWFPLWHYAVVIGYDLDTREIILRSGANKRLTMPLSTFEHTWARSQYWAMLALSPGQLPATALPSNYLQSLLALAHSNKQTQLQPAYAAALQRWPADLPLHMAAGNHAYANGDLKGAKQIFLDATASHPESAAAHNNLAQTLSDLGQFDAALDAINRALQIGGPLEAVFRSTLAEIEQKKRAAKPELVK